jgi:hypothetical protein
MVRKIAVMHMPAWERFARPTFGNVEDLEATAVAGVRGWWRDDEANPLRLLYLQSGACPNNGILRALGVLAPGSLFLRYPVPFEPSCRCVYL